MGERTNGSKRRRMRRRIPGETLESRCVCAALPWGATVDDTGEFMLGDVLVSVVLLESNGARDTSTEDWTAAQIADVKSKIVEGTQWWEETLALQSTRQSLDFHYDFTYAEDPLEISYEPISRPSDDFTLWIDEFFQAADVPAGDDFSQRIRAFNHRERLEAETHWAFTIFVVNAAADPDHRFAAQGSFQQSFAYAGGRFFVTTSERPASAIAHETGHMFWALDEYAGGASYDTRRGYYNAQNTNGADDNPHPESRTRSIMDTHLTAYANHELSASARELIGWRDSDHDGLFDVLDVAPVLQGSGTWDAARRNYRFQGTAAVQALDNQNSSGTGHDLTMNRLEAIQIRTLRGGEWQEFTPLNAYTAALDLQIVVPEAATFLELRVIDYTHDLASEPWSVDLPAGQSSHWQNSSLPLDVNADGVVSPIDALLVINWLNRIGAGPLAESESLPPYLDCNGDRQVSPIDVLLVINYLNDGVTTPRTPALGGEGEGVATQSGEPGNETIARDVWTDLSALTYWLAIDRRTTRDAWWLAD